MHVIRPDRVYRTSVLSPIVGYSPGSSVQQVAANFTSPFAPNGLQGLRDGAGPIATWWANLKAKWAASKLHSLLAAHGLQGPPGPAYQQAQQIAPQIAGQVQMLAMLAPNAGGGPYASAMSAATRRWATYYTAG